MARTTKPEIVYRPEANRDLAAIATYTIAQWGKQQARLYLGDIRRTIERLPISGHRQPRSENLHPGLRRIRSGRHFVYFILGDERIEIVRVVHERVDYRALLD